MYLKKFLKYMASEKGRIFTMNTVAGTGVVMFCVKYVPNTILVNQFKSVVQAYKNGQEREVPEQLQRRFELAMDLCKCTDFEKKYLEPFIVGGFDTVELGSTKSKYGAHIGLPTNYLYEKKSEIERANMKVRDKEIDWSSEDGQNLQNALVLTEIEQVFGMARSILLVKTNILMLTSFYAPLCLAAVYGANHYLNLRMKLHARHVRVRLVLYTIMGLFGYGVYSFLTDYTQVYYETKADKELAEIGPEVVDAGVKFYEKILQKNVALRNLSGQNLYTALGNEHYLLRQKSLPLTVRKKFFEMKKKEFEEANAPKLTS